MRDNLFSSTANSIASVIMLVLLTWLGINLFMWMFFDATWQQIWNNLKLFAVYRYPVALLWRPLGVVGIVMFLLGVSSGIAPAREASITRGVFWSFSSLVFLLTVLALLSWESVRLGWVLVSVACLAGYTLGRERPAVAKALPWLWGASLPISFILLYGLPSDAESALRVVETREWGGFMLTMIISIVGITVSFPLGIALALGRRSKLPAIKYFCITFIEVVRGAPLISWLFIASLLVPLLFNVSPDRIGALSRALVAVTLFSSAYMAENVRGGLQAVPRGQREAAQALGLSGWQTLRMIVLPQALKAVIPAIVGQSIGLFKDTSLVFIVGLFDFFNIANTVVANQPESLLVTGGIRLELSLFVAVVYFFFAYRMSIASRQLEKSLGVGER
jgi:general L-amino acid transport system permease protein